MRGVTAGAMLLGLLLPQAAAAQLQEESVQVPASRQTIEEAGRAADEAERAAEEALQRTEGEAQAETELDAAAEVEAELGAETEPEAEAGTEAGASAEAQPAPAWREVAAPEDAERIADNERAYGAALGLAERSGTEADRAELRQILADLPQPIDEAALPGRWDCRTVRFVEEPADFRVYGWFPCQISELPQGLLLEKLGGSELTAGYLYRDSETRMIYLGFAHGAGEAADEYAGAATPAERRDPGVLTQRGPDRLLLAKPDPVGAADYDFLELRRP